MKKLAAITASLALTAAMATAVSAAPEDTTSTSAVQGQVVSTTTSDGQTLTTPLMVDEPIVIPSLVTIAPAPLEIKKLTYFFDIPKGTAIAALGPQIVTPTGNMVGDWVEIYTWLGTAWIFAPGYVAYPQ